MIDYRLFRHFSFLMKVQTFVEEKRERKESSNLDQDA